MSHQPATPGEVSNVASSTAHRVAMQMLAGLVLVFAAVGALVPGAAGEWLDAVAVTLVIAAPLLRVTALVVEFARERDWRFVGAAVALLAVVATGAALAA